ncbi:exodeoxyribonuclease VII large subunit [Kangiella sediminilitoris]|uniref:Exodeoxyribonuclease 7 large subunit n=1 Tax=Kangiella sediminilitoris TaxID=1144748 RepID=A0A1B3BBX5_9GAMM|nr:exodeoxyribonuclease VII large subunit [Kangiella sediminilitoris]AOE50289.1 Exodeoxyribonuclease 7 large subunit [Kangiella sediminilitoris]
MIQPILQPQEPTEQRKVYSVAEIALRVRRQLEQEIGQIWITGEISNLATPRSGHWYFTLKDSDAQLRCAMFKNRNRSVRFNPEDGQQVLLRAKLSLYEPRGDLQLIAEYMEPAGEGALQIAFNRLKEKLNNEGLFDPELKRPIPAYPNKIGIITSATGAAIRDVLTVLKRRMPQVPIIIYPTQVQGEKAAKTIIQQLKVANERQECDVLLVTRGGGSLEDMWCFNDEQLAREIRNSRIPVVSAVGHEVDTSISDLVADLRAPTPSAAAEMMVPNRIDILHKFQTLERRLINEFQHRLEVTHARLDKLTTRIVHPKQRLAQSQIDLQRLIKQLNTSQERLLEQKASSLSTLSARLKSYNPHKHLEQSTERLVIKEKQLRQAIKHQLKYSQQTFALAAQKLNDISPLATLKRGYSITQDEAGKPLKSATEAKKAKILVTRLNEGEVRSKVIDS